MLQAIDYLSLAKLSTTRVPKKECGSRRSSPAPSPNTSTVSGVKLGETSQESRSGGSTAAVLSGPDEDSKGAVSHGFQPTPWTKQGGSFLSSTARSFTLAYLGTTIRQTLQRASGKQEMARRVE